MIYAKLSEFAKTVRFGRAKLLQWCREGMPHLGAGRNLRIPVNDAKDWIDRKTKAEERQRLLDRMEVLQ